MEKETLVIVDLGAHNNQKLAKIVRENNVYCVVEANLKSEEILKHNPKAISVIGASHAENANAKIEEIKKLGLPVFVYLKTTAEKDVKRFLFKTCKFKGNFTIKKFIENEVESIKQYVGKESAICALSGGVDSSVCAALVQKAIGSKLTCIFVDTGLMRKNEPEKVRQLFAGQFGINLVVINAKERFLTKLKGITDPEKKRKIIGEEFIRVFEDEKKKFGKAKFLVQGTIYPDIIESNSKKGVVKSHHNVGGLPEELDFKLIEPLKWLFKDEVRKVGLELGLPAKQIFRQPFPGPGLGVRVVGEVTENKLEITREADDIFCSEIENAGLDKTIWQYFALCPGVKSVGVKNDKRVFGEVVCLRAILSSDAMSAGVAQIPYPLLDKISKRIANEVDGVSRVVYDITAKPPATIEWE